MLYSQHQANYAHCFVPIMLSISLNFYTTNLIRKLVLYDTLFPTKDKLRPYILVGNALTTFFIRHRAGSSMLWENSNALMTIFIRQQAAACLKADYIAL